MKNFLPIFENGHLSFDFFGSNIRLKEIKNKKIKIKLARKICLYIFCNYIFKKYIIHQKQLFVTLNNRIEFRCFKWPEKMY